MKIGIVCYPTFGGSGVLATELGKALAEKGHEIHFITYQQPVRLNGFHANIFYHEVRVPTYPLFDYPPYELALASTMVDVILNHDLDLIHAHYAIPIDEKNKPIKDRLQGILDSLNPGAGILDKGDGTGRHANKAKNKAKN